MERIITRFHRLRNIYIYRNYNSPSTRFNYGILLKSIVFSIPEYLNKTISESDVFDSTPLRDRSRLPTPRKTSPKPSTLDVSRQLKNLGRLVAR